ncbi:MAG: periplasmic heavy metal sensor [FCB group bacterium]|nr:periplasmic heavy metal sensor [FCB group bacterium]MBL7028206.1 periplasmic heavy metal sensor [Candidatus Neomarinimicrobiota bacterium]MBL7122488.1 periplasmic heavy metal sensor [Candidatus Neomarinimicrobiota bacterium]
MLDIIKQKRMMQITIALLVILNLALISSMVINKRPGQNDPDHPRGLEGFLKSELGLTDSQTEAMHNIRKQHFDNAHPLLSSLADSLELLISESFKPMADSTRANELVLNISNIHVDMDRALYDHFVELNALCTPEQQARLKDLAGELMRGGSQPPPPQGMGAEGRPPHPEGQAPDRRPPPRGQGPGSGAPPPRDR